jgi:hypothetical protein
MERCPGMGEYETDIAAAGEGPAEQHGPVNHGVRPAVSSLGYLRRGQIACAYAMDQPPSIGRVAPVMSCAAGLHRKTVIAPTASMAINRPVGWRVAR